MMVSDTTLRFLNPSRRVAEVKERQRFGDDGAASQAHKREAEFEYALKRFAKNTGGPGDTQDAAAAPKKADVVMERARTMEREIMKDPL